MNGGPKTVSLNLIKNVLRFASLYCFFLASCAPIQTSLPATLPITIAPKIPSTSTQPLIPSTQTTTLTSLPTVAATPTATPTLSQDQFPALAKVAVNKTDLKDGSFYAGDFGLVKPSIKDISDGLDSQFDCSIDCHRDLWSVPGFSATITMVRTKTNDDALELSKDLCLRLPTTTIPKYFASEIEQVGIKDFEDCEEIGTPSKSNPNLLLNTWVLQNSGHEIYLTSTKGTVFLSVRLYILNIGDGSLFITILDTAALQIQKLKEAGYSE